MAAANKGNKPRVRSIRFAAGHDAEGSQSHVHFDEKLHDSVVMVTQESDSSFLVKVGFLKILHRYEITFTLPPVLRLSKDVREAPVPSLHLKLLSVMPIPEGYSIKCEYSAHKEGVLKEEMLLACEGGAGTCVRVTVQARVMGEPRARVWLRGRRPLGRTGFLPSLSGRGVLALARGSQVPSPHPPSRAQREGGCVWGGCLLRVGGARGQPGILICHLPCRPTPRHTHAA